MISFMYLALFLFNMFALFGSQIQIGNEVLTVEISNTPATRVRGLMGRKELPQGTGMLFVYEREERLTFWMKDTVIPLSIAFFDDDKICINILDMDPPIGEPLIRYRSTAPARYALEVAQGWFEKHHIARGAKFSFLDRPNQIK